MSCGKNTSNECLEVTRIIAGAGISINPTSGLGNVTVTNTGGGGGVNSIIPGHWISSFGTPNVTVNFADNTSPQVTGNIYVTKQGNDANLGNFNAPLLTIGQAYANIIAYGDASPSHQYIIFIESGSWSDNFSLLANTIIQGVNQLTTILTGNITSVDPNYGLFPGTASAINNCKIDGNITIDTTSYGATSNLFVLFNCTMQNNPLNIVARSTDVSSLRNNVLVAGSNLTGGLLLLLDSPSIMGTLNIDDNPGNAYNCIISNNDAVFGSITAGTTNGTISTVTILNSLALALTVTGNVTVGADVSSLPTGFTITAPATLNYLSEAKSTGYNATTPLDWTFAGTTPIQIREALDDLAAQVSVLVPGSGWALNGNAVVLPNNVLGTTNNVPMSIIGNGFEALKIESGGSVNFPDYLANGSGAQGIVSNGAGSIPLFHLAPLGSQSVSLGLSAGNILSTGMTDCINLGFQAGQVQDVTSARNINIGSFAGDSINSGTDTVNIGYDAGSNLQSSQRCINIGTSAGKGPGLINPADNCFIGYRSGETATASLDTAVGVDTLKLDTGGGNTAFGYQVLKANTTGSANVGIGYSSLTFESTGSGNTVVGASSGNAISTDSNLTMLGYNCDQSAYGIQNSTAIGAGVIIPGTNNVIIGDNLCYTGFRSNNRVPNTVVDVRGSISLGVSSLKNSNYPMTSDDYCILVDSSGGGVTITLPSATYTGMVCIIINTVLSAFGTSIVAAGGNSIVGGVSTLLAAGTSYSFIADGGSNWYVTASH